MSVLIISFLEKFRGSEIFQPPTSASGLWLRPHMMGRPMARLVAQQARITMKAGEVLCLCWLYRMGEVTAKNLSTEMATRWKMDEVEHITSIAR